MLVSIRVLSGGDARGLSDDRWSLFLNLNASPSSNGVILGHLLFSPDIQLEKRERYTRDNHPGDKDTKVQTDYKNEEFQNPASSSGGSEELTSISGPKNKGSNGIRDVVEWRRIAVVEYPRKDVDREDRY